MQSGSGEGSGETEVKSRASFTPQPRSLLLAVLSNPVFQCQGWRTKFAAQTSFLQRKEGTGFCSKLTGS